MRNVKNHFRAVGKRFRHVTSHNEGPQKKQRGSEDRKVEKSREEAPVEKPAVVQFNVHFTGKKPDEAAESIMLSIFSSGADDLAWDVRTKGTDQEVEEKRFGVMKSRGMQPVRKGRADTGKHVVDNAKQVEVASALHDLVRQGYVLQDALILSVPKRVGGVQTDERKYVVRFEFGPSDSGATPETEAVADFFRGKFWNFLHVWNNCDPQSDGGSHTVNLVGGFTSRGKTLRYEGCVPLVK